MTAERQSIGRAFGLSDDGAQKRMKRALQRLRRILAQRGIRSTAGTLSAVLAGSVPRDLPAAASKILSATHHVSSTRAAGTGLPTVAMTTQSKIAIAAALAIVAVAPIIYQQRRIAALQAEIRSLHQRAPVPALVNARVADVPGDAGAPRSVRDRLPDSTDPPATDRAEAFAAFSGIARRESFEDLPEPGTEPEATRDAVNYRWVARQEALRAILTPEQMAIYQQAGNPFEGTGG